MNVFIPPSIVTIPGITAGTWDSGLIYQEQYALLDALMGQAIFEWTWWPTAAEQARITGVAASWATNPGYVVPPPYPSIVLDVATQSALPIPTNIYYHLQYNHYNYDSHGTQSSLESLAQDITNQTAEIVLPPPANPNIGVYHLKVTVEKFNEPLGTSGIGVTPPGGGITG